MYVFIYNWNSTLDLYFEHRYYLIEFKFYVDYLKQSTKPMHISDVSLLKSKLRKSQVCITFDT